MGFVSTLLISSLFILMTACGNDSSADETLFSGNDDMMVNGNLAAPAAASTPDLAELELVNEVVKDFLGAYPALVVNVCSMLGVSVR